jgi:hypothetical protein
LSLPQLERLQGIFARFQLNLAAGGGEKFVDSVAGNPGGGNKP